MKKHRQARGGWDSREGEGLGDGADQGRFEDVVEKGGGWIVLRDASKALMPAGRVITIPGNTYTLTGTICHLGRTLPQLFYRIIDT